MPTQHDSAPQREHCARSRSPLGRALLLAADPDAQAPGSGNGDTDLTALARWDAVPEHWEVGSKEIDPAAWHDEHGQVPAGPGDDPKLETVPGSTTGVPLPGNDNLPGAAVDNWTDYPDRMWTIINSFQQTHALPPMSTTLPGHGFDEADLSFLPEGGWSLAVVSRH